MECGSTGGVVCSTTWNPRILAVERLAATPAWCEMLRKDSSASAKEKRIGSGVNSPSSCGNKESVTEYD